MNKHLFSGTARQCPKVTLQLLVDKLISEGFSHHSFVATQKTLSATLMSIRHSLIIQITSLPAGKKQQILQTILAELLELEDALYMQARLYSRKGKWVQEYRHLQLEIKKLRVFIEKRWNSYLPADTAISKSDLLHYRCQFQQPLHQLRKRLLMADPTLINLLLAPVLYCIRPGNNHAITWGDITHAEKRIGELNKATAPNTNATLFTEAEAIPLLLKTQSSCAQFISWYRQHIQQACNQLAEAGARISYLHTECTRVLLHVQDQPGSNAGADIIKWLENYARLIEQQAAATQNSTPKRENTFTKIIYKESGGVVAEFYRMHMECGFIKDTDMLPLLETVAMFSELPFTRNPSGNYLYGEVKRKLPRNKEVLLRYINKCRDYLNAS